jgi:hypothetical protein
VKKKLAMRIDLLERLRAEMESKYGASDAIVLDLAQEIKSLQSKSSDQTLRNAGSSTIAAEESDTVHHG